jgi:Saxitoxin biosynthesis operon protein SxtJ
MAGRVPARLTASEGRKFGVTVGGAFLVIAALMYWRHHVTRAEVVGALGTVFVLAGLVIPTQLGPVERAWMGLAHGISKITTPIFMGIVYYVVMTPIGLIRRAFGGNPLKVRAGATTAWAPHNPTVDPKSMERQF